MLKEFFYNHLKSISLSMFRKDFIGIFHGSFSVKTDNSHFIINTKDAIFDHISDEDLIELGFKEDYRWKEASLDSKIHRSIYQNISKAKYISYTMPPFVMAYALNNTDIIPEDFFGATTFKKLEIYDPKQYDDWYERAEIEIYHQLIASKQSLIVIRGYGVYAYARDIHELAKQIAVLENSCKILIYSAAMQQEPQKLCRLHDLVLPKK